MYNNPYLQPYNPQATRERIDTQIAQLQQMKEQLAQINVPNQQPSINQTFQLAPTHGGMRFVNSLSDVQKEMVYSDTPFFSNDMSVVWVKNAKGNIKSYELKEIAQKDDKDLIIEGLQIQINQMKEMIENAKPNNLNADEPTEDEKSTGVSNGRTSKKK